MLYPKALDHLALKVTNMDGRRILALIMKGAQLQLST